MGPVERRLGWVGPGPGSLTHQSTTSTRGTTSTTAITVLELTLRAALFLYSSSLEILSKVHYRSFASSQLGFTDMPYVCDHFFSIFKASFFQ